MKFSVKPFIKGLQVIQKGSALLVLRRAACCLPCCGKGNQKFRAVSENGVRGERDRSAVQFDNAPGNGQAEAAASAAARIAADDERIEDGARFFPGNSRPIVRDAD